MNKLQSHIDKIGWQFDNTYSKLPGNMFSKLGPTPVKAPEVVVFNHSLSKEMGLDFSNTNNEDLALIFSGNLLPEGSDTIAQAYAGHQFGHLLCWVMDEQLSLVNIFLKIINVLISNLKDLVKLLIQEMAMEELL